MVEEKTNKTGEERVLYPEISIAKRKAERARYKFQTKLKKAKREREREKEETCPRRGAARAPVRSLGMERRRGESPLRD